MKTLNLKGVRDLGNHVVGSALLAYFPAVRGPLFREAAPFNVGWLISLGSSFLLD